MRSAALLLAVAGSLSACTVLYAPDDDLRDVDLSLCSDVGRDEFVNINDGVTDLDDPSVSPSGLELYFNRGNVVLVAERRRVCGVWGDPQPLVVDDGTGDVTNPSLGPAGSKIYFVRGPEIRELSRASLDDEGDQESWSNTSVLNEGLRERIDQHYMEQGFTAIDVSDVFRPSEGISLVSVHLDDSVRRIYRDDGVSGTEPSVADAAPKEVWSPEDESSLYFESSGDILASSMSPAGDYEAGVPVGQRGGDPWVLTVKGRSFLYFVTEDRPRQLRVSELE